MQRKTSYAPNYCLFATTTYQQRNIFQIQEKKVYLQHNKKTIVDIKTLEYE